MKKNDLTRDVICIAVELLLFFASFPLMAYSPWAWLLTGAAAAGLVYSVYCLSGKLWGIFVKEEAAFTEKTDKYVEILESGVAELSCNQTKKFDILFIAI